SFAAHQRTPGGKLGDHLTFLLAETFVPVRDIEHAIGQIGHELCRPLPPMREARMTKNDLQLRYLAREPRDVDRVDGAILGEAVAGEIGPYAGACVDLHGYAEVGGKFHHGSRRLVCHRETV